MRSHVAALILYMCSAIAGSISTPERKTASMRDSDLKAYSLPTVVLYGDDSNEDHYMPLSRISVIAKGDMDALWHHLGIDTSDWEPTDPFGVQKTSGTDFPMLYAAQGFIAFEREYSSEQLKQLIFECERASEIVHDEAAKRTAETILEAARLQRGHHGRLLFRAGMCSPSDAADSC
jgi:hypothetical protein